MTLSGSIKSKMAADGHLGLTALSRVSAVARNPASAGLSCCVFVRCVALH